MRFAFLVLVATLGHSSLVANRHKIDIYVEAGREFQFDLMDYTHQEGTYLFDEGLDWAKLSDSGELTLNPKVTHVGAHALELEVKKDELSSIFYDLDIEVKKAIDVYTFELTVDKTFAKILPNETGISGTHSLVGDCPSWLNLTEDGILFGKPDTGGKEEVLVRVKDGGKTTVYWVVLKTLPLGPSIGSFVKVRPGTFQMGSPEDEEGRYPDEVLHQVTLTKSFEIQTTEVTQAQWHKVMKENPSHFSEKKYCPGQFKEMSGVKLCPKHPVEQVSWNDIKGFLYKLNDRDRKYHYRLPTEAEWEFAARGKTQTAYSFGASSTDLGNYGWYSSNSDSQTHSVGSKKANPIGLYDVHGNVWEWVEDAYKSNLGYVQTDPLITSGSHRVVRSGGWLGDVRHLRSAFRGTWEPTTRFYFIGFRLVRTPK